MGMDKKTIEKLKEVQELLAEKERIEKRLEEMFSPEKHVVLPAEFSLNEEILKIIRDFGDNGAHTKQVLQTLRQSFPDYGMNRKRVASGLAYLKNTKKQIEIIGRGMYRIIAKV